MKRQPSSRMCFVCGRSNPIGLRLKFDFDGQRVWTTFTPQEAHQGYPGVLHGGLASTILDEVLGRTAIAHGLWMVTAKMEIRYRHPIPIGQPLTAVGELLEVKGRMARGHAEIHLQDGTVAAEATGVFVQAPQEIQARWADEIRYGKVDENDQPAAQSDSG